ncbi:MAG: DUF1190 family protein [Sodalis sp. (in: enterobacteria)]
MKRTKQIHHSSFRKYCRSYHIAPVALAVSAVFGLAGCEKSDESISLYMNSEDCTRANPFLTEQYTTAYNAAQQEVVKTAPKYTSRADCVAEFGEEGCVQLSAKAGMAAESQHSGSIWMPLMAGYMMGHMIGGDSYAQQPPLTSRATNISAPGQFVNASGNNYGVATNPRSMAVPKITLAPKPVTTKTITRGGFGEIVAKQNSLLSNSATPHRTMGS